MGPYKGDFPTGFAPPVGFLFSTFDSNDPSASVTITGLAVGDIKVFKDLSLTERASTAGYAVDTDFDGIVGVHSVSIDIDNDTDAGFFAAGSEYDVVVSSVTIDGATVNFHVGSFSIERVGGTLALIKLITAAGPTKAEMDAAHALLATSSQVAGIGAGAGGAANFQVVHDNTITDTIDNAAAVDKGGGLVGIPVTGHAFTAGKEVTIAGTTNYNNAYTIVSQTTNEVVITETYQAEAFGGTETIVSSIKGIVFVGSVQGGTTFVNTRALDGIFHDIDDDGDDIDLVQEYAVGGGRVGSSLDLHVFVQGNGDQIAVRFYDFTSSAWETVRTIAGANGTSVVILEIPLLLDHTGKTTEAGTVLVRYETLSTTPSNLSIDQALVSAVASGVSAGYPDGRLWLNTALSNENTDPNVDGTAGNPVSTMAAIVTLSASTNLTDVHVVNGSAVVLGADMSNFSFFGDNWTLDLSDEIVTGVYVQGATVSGAGTAASEVHFEGCDVGTMSVQIGHFDFCAFSGTVTMTLAADYKYHNCYSGVAGQNGPTFAKTAGQAITAQWRNWSDSINLTGLEVGDTVTISGRLGTVDLGSPGGAVAVEIRGTYKEITNVGSAVVNTDGAIKGVDVADIFIRTGYAQNSIWIDTINGAPGTTDYIHGVESNPVNSIADARVLAASLGISRYMVAKDSSLTFAAAQTGEVFKGDDNWTLALGGQNVASSVFIGATVSGVMAGTGVLQKFRDCIMNATSIIKGTCFYDCQFAGTITVVEAGEFLTKGGVSSVAGAGAPIFDFGAALNSSNLSVRNHSGGWEIKNMGAGTGTYNASFEGDGQIIWHSSCSATSNASIRGHWKITDNAGGAVTVTLDDITTDVAAIPTTAMRGTDNAALASVATEARLVELDAANLPTDVAAIPTTAMRGTDSAALASVATEARLAELDAANLPTDVAAIPTTAMRGTDGAALASVATEARLAELDAANLPADIAALNDLSTSDVLTQVNAALDAAISELSQGAPTATPSLRTAAMLLYMALRDKSTVTATERAIYDDAGTKIAKSTLSDDGTTFTDDEMVSGA